MIVGEVKMEVLRLTYAGNRFPILTTRQNKREWNLRSSIHAAYHRCQCSYLSVAVYLTVVATVAVYDIILTIQYWQSLKQMESNPIGRWLMNLDHIANGTMPNLILFITMKSIGTLFVLATILTLVLRRSRIGHPVGVGVSSFQVWLAAYLTYGVH